MRNGCDIQNHRSTPLNGAAGIAGPFANLGVSLRCVKDGYSVWSAYVHPAQPKPGREPDARSPSGCGPTATQAAAP